MRLPDDLRNHFQPLEGTGGLTPIFIHQTDLLSDALGRGKLYTSKDGSKWFIVVASEYRVRYMKVKDQDVIDHYTGE